MCHKCFEVEESMFASPQVVLRNPLLSHNDDSISVHTRPKKGSYRLAPLYAGKFIEVVSKADSKEERDVTYYRVRSGGWINAAHVISVPCEGSIGRLARFHIQLSDHEAAVYAMQDGVRSQPPAPVDEIDPQELVEFTKESIELMESNPAYGIVMASLTMLPVLKAVARRRSAASVEEEKSLCDCFVGFLYYVMYVTIEELECSMDDELPINEGTMLPLFQDTLVRCVAAAEDLQERWHVALPEGFASLLLRTIAVLGRVQLLIPYEHKSHSDTLWLRSPSVITAHNAIPQEQERLQQAALVYTSTAARLLLSLPCSNPTATAPGEGATPRMGWDVRSLLPIREVLTYGHNESLEKVFCDLTAWCVSNSLADQYNFLQVDPLEIAVRLCKASNLAESQLSVLKLVSAAAHHNPRNISIIAPIMVGHLLSMASMPRSPAVGVAAVNCFCKLAYNDPHCEAPSLPSLSSATPLRYGKSLSSSPSSALCTHVLHPHSCPFQRGQTFTLDNGNLVNLCSGCAAHHPPANAVSESEPTYLYFACQCICCRGGSGFAQPPLPAPSVPVTSAIVSMSAGNVSGLLVSDIKSWPNSPELLSAVGRLALRMRVAEDVIHALFNALLAVPDLRPFADAALAVACNRHLPCFDSLLAQHAKSPLCQYIREPYSATVSGAECCRRTGDTTGGSSSGLMRSALGLSPSPDNASTCQSRNTHFNGSSATLLLHSSYPAVDLFPASSRCQDGGL